MRQLCSQAEITPGETDPAKQDLRYGMLGFSRQAWTSFCSATVQFLFVRASYPCKNSTYGSVGNLRPASAISPEMFDTSPTRIRAKAKSTIGLGSLGASLPACEYCSKACFAKPFASKHRPKTRCTFGLVGSDVVSSPSVAKSSSDGAMCRSNFASIASILLSLGNFAAVSAKLGKTLNIAASATGRATNVYGFNENLSI